VIPARLVLPIGAVVVAGCGGSPSAPSARAPQVAGISPSQGSSFGGTSVTLTGSNFTAPATVLIGGAPATNVVVVDAATIRAVTAAHAAGTVDVTVATGSVSGTLRGSFTYMTPTVNNEPPRLVSLAAQGTRPREPAQFADFDEIINVTATVTDNETAVSALAFEWTADAGSFTGTGTSVRYQAPRVAGSVTIRLKITERYMAPDSAGLPVEKESTTFGTVAVSVHDSPKEVADMSRDFIELFSQSSVPPETVVRNFQDGCGAGGTGRRDELQQVRDNREYFLILDRFVGTPRVTVAFDTVTPFRDRREDAWAEVAVRWTSRCLKKDESRGCPSVGHVRNDEGVDWVTARYDTRTSRWWLCDSDYQAKTNILVPYLR
jgi:hypothetical protein